MSEHELWNELGNLYFMSGAYNQAVYAYNRSIQLDSHFGRPYSNLALAYVQQGKYQEAIELYRSSIELLADNKEKAISWSRLGSVYRHLKDYTKAVVAYQQADELDPQNIVDDQPHKPADDSLNVPMDMPQSASDALSQPVVDTQSQKEAGPEDHVDLDPLSCVDSDMQSIEEDGSTSTKLDGETDSMCSNMDISASVPALKVSVDSSLSSPVPVVIATSMREQWPDADIESELDSLDDSTASWALADLTRYQQDISESPEPGSLTSWGEPEHPGDDDWDLYPSLEPESDVYQPDADGDDLTKWMPIPEEEPSNELETVELFKDLKKEMLEPDVIHSHIIKVNGSANCLQSSADDILQCSADFSQQDLTPIPEQSSSDITKQNPMIYPLALPARSS